MSEMLKQGWKLEKDLTDATKKKFGIKKIKGKNLYTIGYYKFSAPKEGVGYVLWFNLACIEDFCLE